MSFPECTVMTISGFAFMFLIISGVGFVHPIGTFGRLIAPYLLCTGTWMAIALGMAYFDTLVQVWIRG